uniref:Uncharacterized protein n=1 Tax=viral metagenome TaxID=1070528 RepID=A0A6C0KG75_9ZZZZ
MDKNEELISSIKKWMTLDNELREIQKVIRQKKQEKKDISDYLLKMMKNNDIGEIDVNDGKLIYSQRKVKTGLSGKHIMNTLNKIFKNEPEKLSEINNSIMDSRETTIKDILMRKKEKK